MTSRAVQVQNERIRRIRQQWLDENGPCCHCGSIYNLEVDHIDPSTKDPRLVAKHKTSQQQNLWYWSKERREIELSKCQVLCQGCHKIKTREEQRKEVCVNGHQMTPYNTVTFPGKPNTRECRECRNASNLRYKAVVQTRRRAMKEILTAPRFIEFS